MFSSHDVLLCCVHTLLSFVASEISWSLKKILPVEQCFAVDDRPLITPCNYSTSFHILKRGGWFFEHAFTQ